MSTRLALWTPLPPLRNGIADYSVELLSYLSQRYDVEVFIDGSYEPDKSLLDRYTIHRYEAFNARHQQQPFDLIIYQVGASSHHYYMFNAIQQWRGIVVLHDLYMGMSVYKYFSWGRNPNKRFLAYLHGEGEQIQREFAELLRLRGAAHYAASERFFNNHYLASFFIDASMAQVVHMPYAQKELQRVYPTAKPHLVKMGVQKPNTSVPPEVLRAHYGISPSTFVIGIFGRINKYKGLHICLDAVHRLLAKHPNILVVVVGTYIQSDYIHQLRAMIDSNEMTRNVHFIGHLNDVEFDRVLLSCDTIVNLRYPGQMQMSGTLMRALAAGKPVIISDIPEWDLLPTDACMRLKHGENEVELLQAHLEHLIEDPALRAVIGTNAQRYADENTTLQSMGKQYAQIIAQYIPDNRESTESSIEEPTMAGSTKSALPDLIQRPPKGIPMLPTEQISHREIHGLLKEWYKLQKSSVGSTTLNRAPKLFEFLRNVVMRVRYLGSAWQIQGALYEALNRQNELLSQQVDRLTEQLNQLKQEIDQLRDRQSR
jgi:glycosyltransferase involved in cell wall biosynthesis